jgi:hypothetical protein
MVIVILVNHEDVSTGFPIYAVSRAISATALLLYLLRAFYNEYIEMKKGLKVYFTNP